ncbi:hypothetical protein [Georgenia sp. SUBG003]|uniref:hypothetical protein n=1 Tax=Georgenia sp. SUBG003 TaxID=1497974 RepID=UPI003AB626B8
MSSRKRRVTWSGTSVTMLPRFSWIPRWRFPAWLTRTLSRDTALVVGMDASGYVTVDGLRYTKFVEGVTPRTVRELGGDVAKMLFYMRPDRQDTNSRVAQEIRQLVRDCADEGLLLIVEILTYRLEDETPEEYERVFPSLVADAGPGPHLPPSPAARASVVCDLDHRIEAFGFSCRSHTGWASGSRAA